MTIKLSTIITLSFVFGLLTVSSSQAQMVNTNPDYNTINYDSNNGKVDSTFIFVFFHPKPATLKAKSVNDEIADFKWQKVSFNQMGIPTITPIKEELGVKTSTIDSDLTENGYMAIVTQGAVVDTFRTWVFLDTLKVNNFDNDNNCAYLKITAKAQYRTNYYWYNFADLNKTQLRLIQNNFTMKWIADTDIRDGVEASNSWQTVTGSVSTIIDDPAPLKDAKYSVTMTNVFNNKATATTTTLIPSVAVHADFEVLRPDDNDFYSPITNLKGEALYKAKFKSKSKNADKFTWSGYGNQLINFERDKIIWTASSENIDTPVDYRPGEYPVALSVTRSSTGCTASTPTKGTILIVDPSSLDPNSIPNVFSPNGDGRSDYFKFVAGQEPVSMEFIDIKIYDRKGLLVYKYNGSTKAWEGWNGKFMGDKGDCSPGVYYFIISGRGWDDISYSSKNLTGFFHLFK